MNEYLVSLYAERAATAKLIETLQNKATKRFLLSSIDMLDRAISLEEKKLLPGGRKMLW